jgi:hypothetical protein
MLLTLKSTDILLPAAVGATLAWRESIPTTLKVEANPANPMERPQFGYNPYDLEFHTKNGRQELLMSLDSVADEIDGKPRFHFAFIRAVSTHKRWIGDADYIAAAGSTTYLPHTSLDEDFPEHTYKIRLFMKMTGKMAIYLRVFIYDRLTGTYVDCDPQASNDPDPILVGQPI